MGTALYADQRDVYLRVVLGLLRMVARTTHHGQLVCDCPDTHGEGEPARDASDPCGPTGRHFYSERIFRVFPCRKPESDQASRADECATVFITGFELWKADRVGDV